MFTVHFFFGVRRAELDHFMGGGRDHGERVDETHGKPNQYTKPTKQRETSDTAAE